MKKIGIVGGIGPESTLDYYRGIIDAFREHIGGTKSTPSSSAVPSCR
jgi:aspartate racemase